MSAPAGISPSLRDRVPAGEARFDGEAVISVFLDWAAERGLELYPAQEEALLEIMGDRHIVLNTPTGSGKSLVALAMHFKAFCAGRRSFYTSPIKALVSEKFFDLCGHFGAENVGMLTGDASLNPGAPVVCCTAEVLAAMALSEGARADVAYAVLDEFHYYGDRERGMAWQIPLLALPQTTFLLMSATLGDLRDLIAALESRTGRGVSLVRSTKRPVPLELSYSEEPLLEQLQDLVERDRAPIYVVSFTQRECAELAQSLTSTNWCGKDEKQRLAEDLKGFRFDTPYGKDLSRFLRHGIAVHHAGLLPKYRLLVEQLAQKGRLKVICGTDTLGVGINVPLRTVLFTRLCKYDGQKTRLLSVRDFQQIAGRAGRKGYDDVGWVVCQAPEHVIENKRMALRAAGDAAKMRKMVKKKPPEKGYVPWDEGTFQGLAEKMPEALTSRFKIEHGMVLNLLQRPDGGYRAVIDLIGASHESGGQKSRLRRQSAGLFRDLRKAGVIEVGNRQVRVHPDLQRDFSLNHTLSLFLVHAVGRLDPADPGYALRVVSFAEAILEDPSVVLMRQQDKIRRDLFLRLKAEGVEFDQRQAQLDQVTWPMPEAELLFTAYDEYARAHPWAKAAELRPKSVARDMYEGFRSFNEYVNDFGLQASEGVLLRHLSQVYKVLLQAVPEGYKTDDLHDAIGYLRSTLERTDSSLLQAWEDLLRPPAPGTVPTPDAPEEQDPLADPKAFRARIRAELHALVKALAQRDYEEVARSLRSDPDPDAEPWTPERLEEAMRPFYADYDYLVFDHRARQPGHTRLEAVGPRQWRVRQVLLDPVEDNEWYLEGRIDLRGEHPAEGALITLTHLGR